MSGYLCLTIQIILCFQMAYEVYIKEVTIYTIHIPVFGFLIIE